MQSIRFRRWSRKRYAVFNSMHRHVTIGEVCKSIADAALGKAKNTLTNRPASPQTFASTSGPAAESPGEPPGVSPLLPALLSSLLLVFTLRVEEVCTPHAKPYLIYYSKPRGERGDGTFMHFPHGSGGNVFRRPARCVRPNQPICLNL